MTTASTRNGFPSTARPAVEIYLARGLAPIPLPPRSKDPGYIGWPDLRLTPDTTDEYFPPREPRNVGILNGAPSDNTADVDLDCPQALLVAPLLLPATGWIFGRKSAPWSHRIYRTDKPLDTAAEKFTDLDGAVLVELRGIGGLTFYPPSTHKDTGEAIAWDTFTDLADVALADLQRPGSVAGAEGSLRRPRWPRTPVSCNSVHDRDHRVHHRPSTHQRHAGTPGQAGPRVRAATKLPQFVALAKLAEQPLKIRCPAGG